MKFLRVDNKLVNLANVTEIMIEPDRVQLYFSYIFDGMPMWVEFTGEQAARVRDYFENHADVYVA